MTSNKTILYAAQRTALELRRSRSIPRESTVNVFDLATSIGVPIQFVDASSLEGMFCKDPAPRIILPTFTHRPPARVAFTCAHELGHHCLGHGTKVTEYLEGSESRTAHSEEEDAVQVFAGHLLMPRPAVMAAFELRKCTVENASPLQLLQIAGEMGVGLRTLTAHMTYALRMNSWTTERIKKLPSRKLLWQQELGLTKAKHVIIVDKGWRGQSVDLEVGDFLAMFTRCKCSLIEEVSTYGSWVIFRAISVGTEAILFGDSSIQLRVAKTGYSGLWKYRYLSDSEEN